MGKEIVAHKLTFHISSEDRAEVRRQLVRRWLRELPGTGELKHTYRYDVEQLRDRSRIYLTRPTRLNKGMDFVIYCENFTKWKKGTSRPPSHGDLFGEIQSICGRSHRHSLEVRRALGRIWNCEDPDKVAASLRLLRDDVQAERALKLGRWMFIEQDLTYWTESGRWMLRGGIEDRIGPLG